MIMLVNCLIFLPQTVLKKLAGFCFWFLQMIAVVAKIFETVRIFLLWSKSLETSFMCICMREKKGNNSFTSTDLGI